MTNNNNKYSDNSSELDYEEFDEQPKESFGKVFLRELLSYVKIIIVTFIATYVLTHFVIINAYVPTGSMNNTIMDHDRLIGSRLSYLFSDPQRGDVIIFKFPDNPEVNYVKRVIGTPGDVVEIKDRKVYVNGEELVEPYIKEPMDESTFDAVYVVPENSYFVLGDNRNSSADSRYWYTTNYVTKDKILAKAWFGYFNIESKKIDLKWIR